MPRKIVLGSLPIGEENGDPGIGECYVLGGEMYFVAKKTDEWIQVLHEPDDIEGLAAAEHESWSGWVKYERRRIGQDIAQLEISISERNCANRLIFGLPCMERWRRQMNTSYEDLPEGEKESDRIEARKKLALRELG